MESFRFEEENDYEYEILRVFSHLVFFIKIASTVIYTEGSEVKKPSRDSKMIKRLAFENLFPLLRHSC